MKHDLKVTLFLLALFVTAQIVGLALLKNALVERTDVAGNRVVVFNEEKVGYIPQMSGPGVLIYLLIGIGVGTALVLLLAKMKKTNWWKTWFFFAVMFSIQFALRTLVGDILAFAIALLLALWKIHRPNVVIHNLTEVLMYSGIAVYIVPLFNSAKNSPVLGIPGNIFWAIVLLVLIAIYDFIAVFKSKHMVTMAQFQTKSNVFAGLLIPYSVKDGVGSAAAPVFEQKKAKKTVSSSQKRARDLPTFEARPLDAAPERKTAILGGGDIAFPLIFTGTVMYDLANRMSMLAAFQVSSIIVLTSTIALALLFFLAKKDKFYPAMPFISAGCLIGYGLIQLFI